MKLPIPQDWDGTTWCQWAVCWPASENWTAILRGLITLPQRGWTWDEKTGSILAVQEIGREITINNLPERRCVMACDDTLAEALLQGLTLIANAQKSAGQAGCCEDTAIDPAGGFQGNVSTPSGDVPIYGTQPPAEIPEGETFPPEFTDEAEFLAHKCSIAHAIFDGVLLTLAFLSGLSISNITALAGIIGAGIAGVIVFPPFAIVLMVGFVFALGGFLAMFLELRNEILANKQDFICAMYDNASVTETIGVIADLLDGLIATITTVGPLAFALKQAALLLFNSDTLNLLYDKTVDVLYPDADCSACCVQCDNPEENLILNPFSGYAIDGTLSTACGLADNFGAPSVTQGATLDLQVTNPGGFKALAVSKSVTPFELNHFRMKFTVDVTQVAASIYFGLHFDDDTCWSIGDGAAQPGLHTYDVEIPAEHFCKTVDKFWFFVGRATDPADSVAVSINSAEILCNVPQP